MLNGLALFNSKNKYKSRTQECKQYFKRAARDEDTPKTDAIRLDKKLQIRKINKKDNNLVIDDNNK